MRRVPLAGLAVAALLATGTPGHADEVTTVGYSGDFAAYIVALWRPTVDAPSFSDIYQGATKAECKWEAAGTSQTGVKGTFYAKVVTSTAQQRERPDEGTPAATAVVCRNRQLGARERGRGVSSNTRGRSPEPSRPAGRRA
jgi:hypothetical protein